jgi:indole-3-glycerol phosphate synthase
LSAFAGAPDVLRRIAERRRDVLAEVNAARPSPPSPPLPPASVPSLRTPAENRFLAALAAARGSAVIAEVKLGSPRLGSLVGRVDPVLQAKTYRAHGATALSVVVEPDFFFGSYDILASCVAASGLPAIAKDFVVDPLQIEWAARAGASAVLLVASLMSVAELRAYAALARQLGLVPLIETHDAADREKLAGAEWEIVGVNNRDLRTFHVELEHSIRALPELPASALKVAESGLKDRADLRRLAAAGFDAFLIGESLLLAEDPGAALRGFLGEA